MGSAVHKWTTSCTYVEGIDLSGRQVVIVNKIFSILIKLET